MLLVGSTFTANTYTRSSLSARPENKLSAAGSSHLETLLWWSSTRGRKKTVDSFATRTLHCVRSLGTRERSNIFRSLTHDSSRK